MISVNCSAKLVRDLQFAALGVNMSDFSNGCEKPLEVRLRGLPDKISVGFKFETERIAVHEITAPCRKCKVCLRNRSKRWAAKAHTECKASDRTWFCTLTFAPEKRFKHLLNAKYRATQQGHIWSDMTQAERFRYIHAECAKDCTLWIKRIRKNSGAPLRYLLVVEPHKDGFPHYHAIIHEGAKPVLWRVLDAAWREGHSRFKVVDTDGAPWYVCKYIAKTALCRIRASQRYGAAAAASLTERVIEVTRSIIN